MMVILLKDDLLSGVYASGCHRDVIWILLGISDSYLNQMTADY